MNRFLKSAFISAALLFSGTSANASVTITVGIVPGSITTAKLENGAVTTPKINQDAVITSKILDGAVTTPKLGTDSVIAAKILDSAVTTQKLVAGAVTTSKISPDAIVELSIIDGAITTPKLATDAVTEAKIIDGAVATAKLGIDAVRGKLSDGRPVYIEGNLGLGVASPSNILDISAIAPIIKIISESGSPGVVWLDSTNAAEYRLDVPHNNVSAVIKFQVNGVNDWIFGTGFGDSVGTDNFSITNGAGNTRMILVKTGNVGISEADPEARLEIKSADNSDWALLISSANATHLGGMTTNGHMVFTGPAPVLSDCGTSPTIAGNDVVAHIIVGTSESGTCTVTFAAPFLNKPICDCDDDSAVQNCRTVETTTTVTLTGTWSDGEEIDYRCFGYR